MKLFGTLSTFVEPVAGNRVVGRQVACSGFLHALFDYSSFDRFHFFLPNAYTRGFFESHLRESFGSPDLEGRVCLFDHLQLPAMLQQERYAVFHLADFTTYLPSLAHLRQELAPAAFPITGVTWSVSERDYLHAYFHMMLGGVQEFDGIICISRSVRDVLEKAFRLLEERFRSLSGTPWRNPIQLEAIPLGVDTGAYLQKDRSESRRRLELPDAPIILVFGRYSYVDKMDLLPILELARRLGKRLGPEAPVFLCAGSDPNNYVAFLREMARIKGLEKSFIFRADIPPDEKPHYYAAADIFLSPSDNLQESFGLSIIEAMAAGLPVAASDFDGYKELIGEGESGFRVPVYWGPCNRDIERLSGILYRNSHGFYLAQSTALDLEAMEEILERLLRDAELRRRLGEAGRRALQSRYSWKEVIERYEGFWNRLGEKAQSAPGKPAPDPFEVPHWKIFSHYPSRSLDPADRLSATGFGLLVLEGKEPAPIYPEMAPLVSTEVWRHVLSLCRHQPRTVRFFSERLRARGVTESQALYHLLWGLKQGLWSLSGK